MIDRSNEDIYRTPAKPPSDSDIISNEDSPEPSNDSNPSADHYSLVDSRNDSGQILNPAALDPYFSGKKQEVKDKQFDSPVKPIPAARNLKESSTDGETQGETQEQAILEYDLASGTQRVGNSEFYVGGESDDQFEVRFSGRRPQLKKRIPVKMEAGVKFEDKPELFQSLNG